MEYSGSGMQNRPLSIKHRITANYPSPSLNLRLTHMSKSWYFIYNKLYQEYQ